MFFPEEIIFSATDACNLHCPHCFVNRTPNKLDVNAARKFLQSCIDYSGANTIARGNIQKVGFSGGEPFLYLDFLKEIIPFCVKNDLMFDQIMTNGDWWKDDSDLEEKLNTLYNAGYDGKIGLSWDKFHGQKTARMLTFIKKCQDIFGPDSVVIQTVLDNKGGESLPLARTSLLATPSSGEFPATPPVELTTIPEIYKLPQTFPSENPLGWKSWKWFTDDYCEGPGQILFIHPDGNIAPCCGFANENKALFIGNINQTFAEVLENARTSKMIEICYEKGLGKYRKELKKQKVKFPGKTRDICTFCDFVCKNC
ncbi:MAG: SPASM domain-containing protein [Treponema sp.]|nr:SPASM domain-containing protein [Treponema sp.]